MAANGNLPAPLQDLVERLGRLPGLGPKSALRMALAMLNWPEDRARDLGRAILELRERVKICSVCNGLADADPCRLCADPTRDASQLCVVAEWDSLLALERGGFFQGRYLILGGLLAPLDGVDARSLDTAKLRGRLAQGQVREVILGLGATIDAENTASFVKNMIVRDFPAVRVTRLALGIPLGSEVKFMDQETLRQSLRHRQEL